jgi:hypothetical protein
MEPNRPRGREKHVTDHSLGVHKRGDGLNTGPVGQSGGNAGGFNSQGTPGGGGKRSGGSSPLMFIILAAVALLGGGGGLGSLLFGGGSGNDTVISTPAPTPVQQQVSAGQSGLDSSFLSALFGGNGSVSTGWADGANTGKLNTSVAAGSRAKYTQILGGGKDTVTIMVYMCGTDLESGSQMGTMDLQEMAKATIGKNVNLLVYTGGCSRWQNNVVSSQVNQIYQIRDGGLACLVQNAGQVSMTKPDTLSGFIQWCAQNFPANRNMLIFWDHGGGSVSGYGYDQKFPKTGSMSLAGIDTALAAGGVKFDFIGFDACLMATMETALMTSQYADYLIGSEETEPGVGWYYTNWLTKLSADPGMATLNIGKNIVDDFVDVCAQQCPGQKTTLSVIDLAELESAAPAKLTAFSKATSQLIQNNEYKTVSNARSNAREFALSNGIDQVDLVHLAKNMGTSEGDALARTLLSAVKYNRTSSNMTSAYGLSIYFPYSKSSSLKSAVQTYEQIGMDSEYARCIQEFASLEASGQISASGGLGAASPLPALLGQLAGGSSLNSADMITQMLGSFLSAGGADLFSGRAMSVEQMASYVADNQFDAGNLLWLQDTDGRYKLTLSEDQWSLVQGLELNMFYDDGAGYIDLGLDNVYDFDEKGALLGETDGTWLAINGQPVAYYHESTVDDGTNYTITGRVPAYLNGERVNLILVFDNDNPYGYIAGARTDYVDGETDTVAKGMSALQPGDALDFVCDYYTYDGQYENSYYLGETMTVTDNMEISNVDVGGAIRATYRFTDIYNQAYWTPVLP